MRDLHTVGQRPPFEATLDLGDEDHAPASQHLDQQYREVRRDQKLAGMAGMMLDTARMVEPIMAMFTRLALTWFAVLASTALTFYALRFPSWERGAIVAGFMVLISLVLRLSR